MIMTKTKCLIYAHIFVSGFLIFGMSNLYGQETKNPVSQTSDPHSEEIDQYYQNLLNNSGNTRIPISRTRYWAGGLTASFAPFLKLFGYASHTRTFKTITNLLSISGSFGIPRAIQGRYWPVGFYFTLSELVATMLVVNQCMVLRGEGGGGYTDKLSVSKSRPQKLSKSQYLSYPSATQFSHTTESQSLPLTRGCIATSILSLGVAIWQLVDAWILPSSKYELVSKKWRLSPTYSYNTHFKSHEWGMAFQYQW